MKNLHPLEYRIPEQYVIMISLCSSHYYINMTHASTSAITYTIIYRIDVQSIVKFEKRSRVPRENI